jgi:hypothetical protein
MYHISGHILWRYSLKNRPENRPKIYGIGTSNKSVPEMAVHLQWPRSEVATTFTEAPMIFGGIYMANLRHPAKKAGSWLM